MLETRKVDNNTTTNNNDYNNNNTQDAFRRHTSIICNSLTDMRYLEECSASECRVECHSVYSSVVNK